MRPLLYVHMIGNLCEIAYYLPDKIPADQCLVVLQRNWPGVENSISDESRKLAKKIGQNFSSKINIAAIISTSEPRANHGALELQKGANLKSDIITYPVIDASTIINHLNYGKGILVTSHGDGALEQVSTSLIGVNDRVHHIGHGNICILTINSQQEVISERYLDFTPWVKSA